MNETAQQTTLRVYRPKQRFYHANLKGTGCALEMELHPAHDDTDGSIMVRIANQSAIGNMRGPTPTYHRFDWENAINLKLDFSDLCQMLQVFRGESESINDGHGLFHRSEKGNSRIVLRHIAEPTPCYSFEVYRTSSTGSDSRAHIIFTPWEALGLVEAISGSLAVICFGIPMVIPRDNAAYQARMRSLRNVSAA